MISLINTRREFEKFAADPERQYVLGARLIKLLGKGISGTGHIIEKHPWLSVGALGGTAATIAFQNNVVGAYTMMNEQRKRNIMLNQEGALNSLVDNANRSMSIAPRPEVMPQFQIQPLA